MSKEIFDENYSDETTLNKELIKKQKKIEKKPNKKKEIKNNKIKQKEDMIFIKKEKKRMKELFLVDTTKDFLEFHEILQIGNRIEKLVKKMPKYQRKRYVKKLKKRHILAQQKNIYKFHKIKFRNVNDFATYISAHRLSIDEIAVNVLRDPVFFYWIKQNNSQLSKKIEEFKTILLKYDT